MYKIVLEGFDGGGKSTLAKAICGELGLIHHTNGGAPKDMTHVMECCASQHYNLHSIGGVMDRVTCISNFCYTEVMTAENLAWLAYITRMSLSGTNLILCQPSRGYFAGMEEYDTEEYTSWLEKNKPRILSNYDFVMGHTMKTVRRCNVILWDHHTGSVNDLIDSLLEDHEIE